ncbi:uncharacterized protein EMH_0012360 [Eimeria mitis]|uniref:Uncharacterized protein n=1 Tax=Eimeria mitis TaxID=44415 RepID=U6JT34_9EIME|nr:uncharacterized protein EMH_0012360 [Eimeria mitis]CDJ27926.1 hypothetical protein, conserved [Eimeria mitis]
MKLSSLRCSLLLGLLCLAAAVAARDTPNGVGSTAAAAAESQLQQEESSAAAVETGASALLQGDNGEGSSGASGGDRPRKRQRGGGEGAAASSEDGPSAETKRKYDEVLEELQNDPRYIRARDRNNQLAEQRRKRVDAWMRGRAQQGPATPSADQQAERERRTKYDKVVGELQQNPKFQRARERLSGSSGEEAAGSSQASKDTKPHNFTR